MSRLVLTAVMCMVLGGGFALGAEAQSMAAGTQFTLTGVVVFDGGQGRAWLQEPTLTRNEVVSLRTGDTIGAYRLSKVFDDRVEMEGPGGKFSIPLAGAGGPAPTIAAASPAPAPAMAAVPILTDARPEERQGPTPAQQEVIRRARETPGAVNNFLNLLQGFSAGSR